MMVDELFILDTKVWDKPFIEEVFCAVDATSIHKTPISPNDHADRMIWHHERDGKYTVKSGYRLASMLTINNNFLMWRQLECSLEIKRSTENQRLSLAYLSKCGAE